MLFRSPPPPPPPPPWPASYNVLSNILCIVRTHSYQLCTYLQDMQLLICSHPRWVYVRLNHLGSILHRSAQPCCNPATGEKQPQPPRISASTTKHNQRNAHDSPPTPSGNFLSERTSYIFPETTCLFCTPQSQSPNPSPPLRPPLQFTALSLLCLRSHPFQLSYPSLNTTLPRYSGLSFCPALETLY